MDTKCLILPRYQETGSYAIQEGTKFPVSEYYLEDLRNKVKVLKNGDKSLLFSENVVERAKYGVSFEELNSLIFG